MSNTFRYVRNNMAHYTTAVYRINLQVNDMTMNNESVVVAFVVYFYYVPQAFCTSVYITTCLCSHLCQENAIIIHCEQKEKHETIIDIE